MRKIISFLLSLLFASNVAAAPISVHGAIAGADNTVAIQTAFNAAVAGETVTFDVNSLISTTIVITNSDIVVEGSGKIQQWSPTYTRPGTVTDWNYYNQMFVVNADRVYFKNVSLHGNIQSGTSIYFPGSFIWFAQGVTAGGVDSSYFQNLRYDGVMNSVAIQTRTGSSFIKLTRNHFHDAAAISMQGSNGVVDGNTSNITAAAGQAPLTAVLGYTDQAFGIDGSDGASLTNNKVYRSSTAPIGGASIGANSNTKNYVIAHNYVYGLPGGIAIYVRTSHDGVVSNNVIDGGSFSTSAAWAFIRIDTDASGAIVANNILKGPPTGSGSGMGIDVSTGKSTVSGNKILFGSNTSAFSLISVKKHATEAADLQLTDNYLQGGGRGVHLNLADNINATTGLEVPVRLKGNVYANGVTTPIYSPGISRQFQIHMTDEQFVNPSYASTSMSLPEKYVRAFRYGQTANFPFSIGINTVYYSGEKPFSPHYDLTTWRHGDTIHNPFGTPGSASGWYTVTSGTFPDSSAPYSQAGASTNGSPTVTGLASTAAILTGDYVKFSAGFPAGPYKVIGKTSSSITVDANATSSASLTVTHSAPVIVTLPPFGL